MSLLLNDYGDTNESYKEDVEVPNVNVNQRPQRIRNIPRKLQECEMKNDNEVGEECDLVHMKLTDVEYINHHESLVIKAWKKEMK